jgi:hypothetical protein
MVRLADRRRLAAGYVIILFGLGLIGAAAASAPAMAEPVDLELVLAADGSGSIDDDELALQREGYAAALNHPRVLAAITSGFLRKIAIAYVEWGAPESQHIIVDWHIIDGPVTARAFTDKLTAAPRAAWGYNSISNAIDFAAAMIADNDHDGTRKIIDVSADAGNIGGRSLAAVRAETIAEGITINGLAISRPGSSRPMRGVPLEDHFRNEVIGGPGAFVVTADEQLSFEDAVLKKLILEIAFAPAETPANRIE